MLALIEPVFGLIGAWGLFAAIAPKLRTEIWWMRVWVYGRLQTCLVLLAAAALYISLYPAAELGNASLLMAYADGLSFDGWRGIDARTIGAALQVHGAGIALRTRTPEVGRQTSSYLAMRLLATLQRGAGVPVLADPIGADEKIIVLSGHDGTVTMLAGLLGLDWHLDGYGPGEAAPGGGLIFELWRRSGDDGHYVRLRYVAQGLDQMRYRQPLTRRSPPLSAILQPAYCAQDCSLAAFAAGLMTRLAP